MSAGRRGSVCTSELFSLLYFGIKQHLYILQTKLLCLLPCLVCKTSSKIILDISLIAQGSNGTIILFLY